MFIGNGFSVNQLHWRKAGASVHTARKYPTSAIRRRQFGALLVSYLTTYLDSIEAKGIREGSTQPTQNYPKN